MILLFVFVGFLYHLTTRVFFKVQKFGINESLEGILFYHNNISSNIDDDYSKSLTDSIKLRYIEHQSPELLDNFTREAQPITYTKGYKEFLSENIGIFPFTELITKNDTLRLLTFSNEKIEGIAASTINSF